MTASQEASLDAWIIKTYLACWKPAAQPADADPYVARVRLKFKPDGSLLKPPKLVNPPSDPAQKPQAKSVLNAVKACDPLPMPAEYRSFYERWKTNRSAGRRPLTTGMSREAVPNSNHCIRLRSRDFSCATDASVTGGTGAARRALLTLPSDRNV